MSPRFDIAALAKRINLRLEELNRLHVDRPIRVTPALSRILENDPAYLPYRKRNEAKKQRPVRNPTVRTLVEIAATLGTTVGDLLGEDRQPLLTPAEVVTVRETISALERLVTAGNVESVQSSGRDEESALSSVASASPGAECR